MTHAQSLIDILSHCNYFIDHKNKFLSLLNFTILDKKLFFDTLDDITGQYFLRGFIPLRIAQYLSFRFKPPNLTHWESVIIGFAKNVDSFDVITYFDNKKRSL